MIDSTSDDKVESIPIKLNIPIKNNVIDGLGSKVG